ncbi:MAG: ATP-binding cassette domain-containing protein, partial [Halobacteria archaeon]
MDLLETISLTKDFGGLRAVDDVNLKVGRGEFLAIIGPNGAGKTTLFNLLSGKFLPSKGEIIFEGKNITKLPPNERNAIG